MKIQQREQGGKSVEFKRVLLLRKMMIERIGKQSNELTEQECFSMDALTLAYMGDVCWSKFIREKLIATGIYHVQVLNDISMNAVSARKQSLVMTELREMLSERELKVAKRARNTNSTVPKSATVEEYRESTAFEGVLGYLYLSGQEERLKFLMEKALYFLSKELKNGRKK